MVKVKFKGSSPFAYECTDRLGLGRGHELFPADHAAAGQRTPYDHRLPALGAGQER
jgi:hypothetical protein